MMISLLLATLVVSPVSLSTPVVPSLDAPRPVAVLLTGRVTGPDGIPIPEARVIVLEANRSTRTDADGRFRLAEIPEGTYGVSVAAIGFLPRVIRITLRGDSATLNTTLPQSVVELPGIQTTATPLGTSVLESPQPLSILQGGALAASQAASLGAVLEELPGLRNASTGSGIGKPVIRGLSSNRVLVLDNGQRVETQQWGDEHAPNVETATAERIEVIRGPASVLYGSDALGGVINVVQRELPDATERGGFLRGTASGSYASNGKAPDASLLLEGARGALGYRGTLTSRRQGDAATPTGPLGNSGLAMTGGSGALGVRGSWGSLTATVNHRNERVEIHEDPAEEPDATPFQRIGATRGMLTANIALGGARLEVDLGAERNRRREFEERGSDEVALGLLATTLTANVHLHQELGAGMAGVMGLSAMRADFEKFGSETLIPDNRADNAGLYAFAQLDRGAWQFTGGARYDMRRLTNEADAELGLAAGTRDYTALSGNLGALYHLSEPLALVLNVGRGFRAPSPFELFSDGVHEGTVRYEIGDPALDNETSFNADLSLRAQSSRVQGEVGVFRNAIRNYIYPNPSGEIDPASGFPIYHIAQGDAVLTGLEASVEYHPHAWLHLRAGGDYTRGQNTTLDIPLAFVAPSRVNGAVRLEGSGSEMFAHPYVEVGIEQNARQSRLDPEDVAPAGYTLASLHAGTELTIGRQMIRLDLRVRNLFNETYRSFLSRYKLYADEPGRNVVVRVAVDF